MESVLPEAKDTARGIPASEQNQGVHSRSVRVRASWSVLFVDAAQQLCSPWLLECDARTHRQVYEAGSDERDRGHRMCIMGDDVVGDDVVNTF